MEFSEERTNIFKAMAEFRKKVVQPKKDANNPFFKSKYVMLEGVVKAIDDAIDGLGLSYIQEATSEDKEACVSTTIIHESGEYIKFDSLSLPVSKVDAQAFGSAVTYAKRYSLSAAFGITSDVDDDGNKATVESGNQSGVKMATAKQVGFLKIKAMEYSKLKGGNVDDFYKFLSKMYKVDDILQTTAKTTGAAITYIEGLLNDKE